MRYGRGNNWGGQHPGNGPFSHLPPWQRPGWSYGRGACWRLYSFNTQTASIKPEDEAAALNEQRLLVEAQLKTMQDTLNKIQERLDELRKQQQ